MNEEKREKETRIKEEGIWRKYAGKKIKKKVKVKRTGRRQGVKGVEEEARRPKKGEGKDDEERRENRRIR